jgi:hypothetical protein
MVHVWVEIVFGFTWDFPNNFVDLAPKGAALKIDNFFSSIHIFT